MIALLFPDNQIKLLKHLAVDSSSGETDVAINEELN